MGTQKYSARVLLRLLYRVPSGAVGALLLGIDSAHTMSRKLMWSKRPAKRQIGTCAVELLLFLCVARQLLEAVRPGARQVAATLFH